MHLLFWLLLLFLPLISAEATKKPPENRCPYCTDTCDRAHEHRSDLVHFDVLAQPPQTTDSAVYYATFESELKSRIKADGGDLYGPRTRNLLHYTWEKVRSCGETVSMEFSVQRNRIYQLLLNFRAVHSDTHCTAYIQDRLPQSKAEFKSAQYDPTASIKEEKKARRIIAERHLFGWDTAVSVEAAMSSECKAVKSFVDSVENFEHRFAAGRFYSIDQMKFWIGHFLEMAKGRYDMEEVRQNLEANIKMISAEVNRPQSRYLQRLLTSLLYIRSKNASRSGGSAKDITSAEFSQYLQAADLVEQRQSISGLLMEYMDDDKRKWKWTSRTKPGWFAHPALFDRQLIQVKFYGPVSRKIQLLVREGISDFSGSGNGSYWAPMKVVIRAINEDYNTDRSNWNKEDQVLGKYYTQALLVAIKDSLLWNGPPKKKLAKKYLLKYVIYPSAAVGGVGGGLYGLYWIFNGAGKSLPQLDAISNTTKNAEDGLLEAENLKPISTTSEAILDVPLWYSTLIILLIVLASLVAGGLILAGCLYLYRQAQLFSNISLDSAAETTAIRVGIKVEKMASTSSMKGSPGTGKKKRR